MYKMTRNNKVWWVGIFAGAISLAYGLSSQLLFESRERASDMLNGMFIGLGSSLLVIGLIFIIRNRLISEEVRTLEENEMNDERNHQIIGKSCIISTIVSFLCLGVMAFLFVGLGYPIPSYVSVGAMYVVLAAMLLTMRIYSKRM